MKRYLAFYRRRVEPDKAKGWDFYRGSYEKITEAISVLTHAYYDVNDGDKLIWGQVIDSETQEIKYKMEYNIYKEMLLKTTKNEND